MERNQKPHTKKDERSERNEVKLHRRYGEIGISAVKAAAVQCQAKGTVNSERSNVNREAKPTAVRKR